MVEVLLTSNRELRKEYQVEDFEMGNPKITINTDRPVESSFESLIACIAKREYY